MTARGLEILYDLAIHNCTQFGPYTNIIYEDQQELIPPGQTSPEELAGKLKVREYTNIAVAREATQLAAGMGTLGIEKGDRVMVMMPNSPEVIISYQAIARAGGVIIPVMPLLKGPEVRYIAENSQAKAVITSPILLPLLRPALSGVASMHYIICTGITESTDNELPTVPYSDVVARGADKADDYLTDLPGIQLSPNDIAVILYTSGTTGRPKGVVLSHRNLVSNAISSTNGGIIPTERTSEVGLAILPLAHAYGLTVSNIAYLSGMKSVMQPRFDPYAMLSAIERHRVTAFAGVPAMFVVLLNTPNAEQYDTSSLEYCASGSAPLPVHILQSFQEKFQCQIREGYGLSEGTTVLTGHRDDMPQKPGSVGKPIDGVEVHIVDEQDNFLPQGAMGEIVARGPNIMQGYYNMPEETAEALRNGWLHTGDMGYFDEDGYLYIVERKKDLIIRGGFNIYPRDVEEVLASHPAVIEAAVVGVPSERMGEEVKAFVVTREPVEADILMAYCRERLANYKTPSQIEFVDMLPRNAVGKIDKKELRKRHVN